MIVPPAIFVAMTGRMWGRCDRRGWAIPAATDIAFAARRAGSDLLTHLPAALRTFLLTLAVVDDLLAITVIAVFYTEHIISPAARSLAVIPLSAFAVWVQRRIRSWWLLIPLAALTWALVHAIRCARHGRRGGARLHGAGATQRGRRRPGCRAGVGRTFEHRIRPVSAGIAVPVFAFFAAGVTVGGTTA